MAKKKNNKKNSKKSKNSTSVAKATEGGYKTTSMSFDPSAARGNLLAGTPMSDMRSLQGGISGLGTITAPGLPDIMGSIGGGSSSPGMSSGFTQDQKNDMVNATNQIAKGGDVFGQTDYNAPGVSINTPDKVNSKEVKKDAHIQYLMETKGISEQEARKLSDKKTKNKKYGNMNNFKDWVSQQEGLNLEIGHKGGLKTTDKYTDGGIEESNPGIREGIEENNMNAVDMVGDLQGDFANDIRNSLGFKQGIQGNLASLIGNSSNAYGMTPQQGYELEAQRKAALNDYSDIFGDNMRKTIGKMTQGGALNSSLTGENLKRGAFDSFGDMLVGLEGSQAQQAEGYRQNAAMRNNSRIGALTGAAQGVGQASMNSLYSPFSNAGNLGKMTDAQSVGAATGLRGQDLNNKQFYDKMRYDAVSTPVMNPNSPEAGWQDYVGTAAKVGGAVLPMLP